MKLGLIARAEDRGIGIQCWEFHRHMRPESTLVVDMGPLARDFPMHLERYPGATVVPFQDGKLPEAEVREWLAGLDVVYMVETPYDFRLFQWANEGHTATVVHTNPEFFVWRTAPHLPRPTTWWTPTSWRRELLPPDVQLVPQPVPLDRWPIGGAREVPGIEDSAFMRDRKRPLFVHVGGHQAMADRNGTRTLLMALRYLTAPLRLRLLGQDRRMPSRGATSRHVTVESHLGGLRDYWRLYDGANVLVMPRRYGGLCLPVLEAMGAGLAVVMTDTEPQRSDWPVVTVPTRLAGEISTGGGMVPLANADPRELAAVMDHLATDVANRDRWHREARRWALANSWARIGPVVGMKLAEAAVTADWR